VVSGKPIIIRLYLKLNIKSYLFAIDKAAFNIRLLNLRNSYKSLIISPLLIESYPTLHFLSGTHLWPIVVGFLCPLWGSLSGMCVLSRFLSDLMGPAGLVRLAASGAARLRFRLRFRLRLRRELRPVGGVGQRLGFDCRRGWADWLDLLHMAALSSRRRLPGIGETGVFEFSKHSNDSSSGEKFCLF